MALWSRMVIRLRMLANHDQTSSFGSDTFKAQMVRLVSICVGGVGASTSGASTSAGDGRELGGVVVDPLPTRQVLKITVKMPLGTG